MLNKGTNIYLSSSPCCSDLESLVQPSLAALSLPLCVCVTTLSYVCCILCPTLKTQHMSALTHADRNALPYCGWFHACRASCPMGKGKKKKKKPFVFNICRNYISPWISLEPSGWIASLIQTLEKNTCWASWSFVRDSCRGSYVQIAKLAPLFRIGRDINIMSCAAHQNCTAPSKRSGKYIMKLMTWFIHATSFCIMFSAKDHVTGVFSALPLCLHYIYEAVTVLWVCLCI